MNELRQQGRGFLRPVRKFRKSFMQRSFRKHYFAARCCALWISKSLLVPDC